MQRPRGLHRGTTHRRIWQIDVGTIEEQLTHLYHSVVSSVAVRTVSGGTDTRSPMHTASWSGGRPLAFGDGSDARGELSLEVARLWFREPRLLFPPDLRRPGDFSRAAASLAVAALRSRSSSCSL